MAKEMVVQHFTIDLRTGEKTLTDKYFHSDLVDELKGYAVHDRDCVSKFSDGVEISCTCGLTETLRKLEG